MRTDADVTQKATSRRWFLIWIGLIIVVVVPWGRFQPHPHWERVAWIPFVSRPVVLRDVIANVLFYVPYGIVALEEVADTRNPILLVTGSAFLLSVASEFTQVFSVSRFPSMTDVVCNAAGAFIGATWATIRNRAHAR
jgi:VanZ family protein